MDATYIGDFFDRIPGIIEVIECIRRRLGDSLFLVNHLVSRARGAYQWGCQVKSPMLVASMIIDDYFNMASFLFHAETRVGACRLRSEDFRKIEQIDIFNLCI